MPGSGKGYSSHVHKHSLVICLTFSSGRKNIFMEFCFHFICHVCLFLFAARCRWSMVVFPPDLPRPFSSCCRCWCFTISPAIFLIFCKFFICPPFFACTLCCLALSWPYPSISFLLCGATSKWKISFENILCHLKNNILLLSSPCLSYITSFGHSKCWTFLFFVALCPIWFLFGFVFGVVWLLPYSSCCVLS